MFFTEHHCLLGDDWSCEAFSDHRYLDFALLGGSPLEAGRVLQSLPAALLIFCWVSMPVLTSEILER